MEEKESHGKNTKHKITEIERKIRFSLEGIKKKVGKFLI